jgi:hypothetical protein
MEYEGLQSIYNAALGEYHSKGFQLVEQDDHVTILFYRDERVAVFSQTGLTIPALHQACQEHLERLEAANAQ